MSAQPPIISIVNHKGGCLKTSVTANLGAALALTGKRVLLLDLDAQQNLTQSLVGAVPLEDGVPTLYDAFVDETGLDHLILPTSTTGLDLVPCSEDFAGADLSLVSAVGREFVLRGCLERTTRLQEYDIVLIDNPPSISLVVVNSLVASDYFLVPCSADWLPMVGLTLLGNSVARLQKVAPKLELLGVVITLYSRTERICEQVSSLLKERLGEKLFNTRIRTNTKAKSAPALRKTIFEFEASPKGRGSEDFSNLAHELLERLDVNAAEKVRGVANG